MKRRKIFTRGFLLFLFLQTVNGLQAQLIIQDNLEISELIQELADEGVKINNVTCNCPFTKNYPYGKFQDQGKTIGLKNGIILTTGSAQNAQAPNTVSNKSQLNNLNTIHDIDLGKLLTTNQSLYDGCIIEFDVVSYNDSLVFEYLFASEEYPEYIENFHDVFGFFISGPGIEGMKNIALVPSTHEPVSVQSINQIKNINFYFSNESTNSIMQYDGYTKVMQAKTAIVPCETYHIKLAIADVGDALYDSGVFISSRTLKSKNVQVRTTLAFPELKTTIEGCNPGELIFERLSGLDKTYTLHFSIDGTAINGKDYEEIPSEITFLVGQSSVSIPIIPIADELIEEEETIIITPENLCPHFSSIPSDTLFINDHFFYNIPSQTTCKGNLLLLNPGSFPEYSFDWGSNSDLSCTTCASPTIQANESKNIPVVVTHMASGCKTIVNASIYIPAFPSTSFSYHLNQNYTSMDVFFKLVNENEIQECTWEFGDGSISHEKNPIHTYEINDLSEKPTFTVKIIVEEKEKRCKNIDSTIIDLRPFFIPNIITPNQDGINDTFKIAGIESGSWKLEVYNRFGQLIYFTEKYQLDWNGQGQNIDAGIYYYVLSNFYRDRSFKGWIHVLK